MTAKKDNWGNQELPGISNEELFSEDWAKEFKKAERSEIIKAYHRDPIFRELWEKQNKEKVESASWRKSVAEARRLLAEDPEWLEATTKRNQELAKDPQWLEATTKASRKKAKDPKWLEANQQGCESRKAKGAKLKAEGREKEFRELFGVKDQHSKKTKKQMSASASERWAKSMKKVSAMGKIYDNIYAASEDLGIHKDTVVYRIKTRPAEYFYLDI
jgi:hypothetical protein